mgnify:CR=1 FL=1
MKQKSLLLVLSLFMMISIPFLTSCSSDDDGDDVKRDLSERIVGAWTRGISEVPPPEEIDEVKKRFPKKAPRKMEEEAVAAYDQFIEYYTADGVVVDIWIEYDAKMNEIYRDVFEGTYTLTDNKMTQKFIDNDYSYIISEKNDVLTLAYSDEDDVMPEFKRMPEKKIQPYLKLLNMQAPSVWFTDWRFDEDANKYKSEIYSYQNNGNVDRYTAINDQDFVFERAYVQHGTWQLDGLYLTLTFKNKTVKLLQRVADGYIIQYYYDVNGIPVSFFLNPTTLDAQQGIIDVAEEVEE